MAPPAVWPRPAATTRRTTSGSAASADTTASSAAARTDGSDRREAAPARPRGQCAAAARRSAASAARASSRASARGVRRPLVARGELGERPGAHLGVRRGEPAKLGLRRRRGGACEQVEADAHVAGVGGPEQSLNRRPPLRRSAMSPARDERPAHLVGERAGVRPVHADRDPVHITPSTRPNTMTAPTPEAERVEGEQQHAGGADRNRHADPFHDRLHRQPLLASTTWNAALIDVRVVPSVAVISVIRSTPASTKRPNDAAPAPAATTAMTASTPTTTAGLKTSPSRRPNRRMSGPASRARNRMSMRLSDSRVRRQEAGQVLTAVLRGGAVEEEEVDDLRPHRRQQLVDEQEQRPARGTASAAAAAPRGTVRSRARRAPPGSAAR